MMRRFGSGSLVISLSMFDPDPGRFVPGDVFTEPEH